MESNVADVRAQPSALIIGIAGAAGMLAAAAYAARRNSARHRDTRLKPPEPATGDDPALAAISGDG
jgi:hypothetical protein